MPHGDRKPCLNSVNVYPKGFRIPKACFGSWHGAQPLAATQPCAAVASNFSHPFMQLSYPPPPAPFRMRRALNHVFPTLFGGEAYRWVVCALLFFATTINYVDRQILSLLKPMLDEQMHWTNEEFGLVNSAFQGAYGLGLLSFGWFVDRFGTKIGYTVSIALWSLAAAGHAFVGSITAFVIARIALGLGEGGNFPAAIKTVALWFPKPERALATSIFNAGTNIGAIAAPAIVPGIAFLWGWQAAFVIAGAAGLLWLIIWLQIYEASSGPLPTAQ